MWANFISGCCCITLVYCLSSRLLYKTAYSLRSHGIYFAYYAVSILVFSSVVGYLHTHTPCSALLSKVLTLPLSFSCNFLFNKRYFRSK